MWELTVVHVDLVPRNHTRICRQPGFSYWLNDPLLACDTDRSATDRLSAIERREGAKSMGIRVIIKE